MAMTIEEDISLGLIHGVSGTGKTLLTQMLLTHLNTESHQIALIMVSPGMSKTSLLKEILREVLDEGDALPAQTQSLLDLLHNHIIDLYRQNKKLVILIDEAHFLTAESLHILRTISNLETPQKKLATTILFAEDLFLRRLSHPSYQSLRNRMYMKVPLAPMGPDETVQYIKFRLLGSGCTDPLFDEEAYAEIHKASGGICRDINRICYNSLSEAYLTGERKIGRDIVKKALA
jgi:general secretion pathway protein A